MTLLTVLSRLRTNNPKGLGATLTVNPAAYIVETLEAIIDGHPPAESKTSCRGDSAKRQACVNRVPAKRLRISAEYAVLRCRQRWDRPDQYGWDYGGFVSMFLAGDQRASPLLAGVNP
jgi:hypothetical protein